jgi:hypothetical protein
MADTKTVRKAVDGLLVNGCVMTGSIKDGHLTVKDNGKIVYRALQKGPSGPWIVSYYNSDRIHWNG